MDDLRGMITFARVVESGSFAAAARKLDVGRAAVSHQIKLLEERLGTRLLHRSTRSLSLTSAGQDYYQSCKLISEEAEAATRRIQSLSDQPVGRISLTCSTNFGLKRIVPLLSQFRLTYPGIELDIELTDDITNLIEGGYDIAIRSGPLDDSDMMSKKICSTVRRICAAPSYLTGKPKPSTPEDLASHDWVTYSRHSGLLSLTKDNRQYKVRIQGPVHTNNAGARLEFILGGHGLGLLPEHDIKDQPDDSLEILLPDYNIPTLDLFAVYPRGAASSLKVRMLIDYLAEQLFIIKGRDA
ncbi:transcriptional regulator [Kiloniella spongiae]|uniref:Transcriptional regulator n=1 Tax=Kiloniella spongiae TaxID=1489064 RepID=A0A0H2MLQ7_9PROT|nr:LysR family transcriptional regulator [Kiloniella spongiae]KLN61667.1 transcriptional regulator [Kiloniella spongiae]